MNVQSVITPAPVANRATRRKAAKVGATPAMTPLAACDAAYEYGASAAGLDGTLTIALKAYSDNESVKADMLVALNVGYMVRKLGVTREESTRIVNLLKYNEKKTDDNHRTFEQQRVMDTVRVLWHRATKMAGIVKAKSDNQIKAEATRATKEAEKKAHEAALEETWNIVNPPENIDVNDAMTRLVLTMKSYHSKYANKFVGDSGMAWRDWLAAAPVATKAKTRKAK